MIDTLIEQFKNELDENISNALIENANKLNEISFNIEIIESIASDINSEPQAILKEIIHDLISSLYSGLQALYRNAYISLRSGIELSLAYIFFLDHNYEYLFWKQDAYDVQWSVLENKETGVLSERYLSMFSNDKFDLLFERCREIYRNCSQFVHGKYEYMHTVKHQSIKYDKQTFEKYLDMLQKITNVIIALLLIRYSRVQLNIDETYRAEIEENLKKLQLTDTLEKIKECWK
ncbi:hypothetical protein [Anaerovorax odorimutans]|uniref:hypothetical protein n=1 Tax=Anaerovorax odorimutans TaxID=109327 RepID=UPI000419D6AA|nr:hypothetical protein [Anaerovorax odorimutans]